MAKAMLPSRSTSSQTPIGANAHGSNECCKESHAWTQRHIAISLSSSALNWIQRIKAPLKGTPINFKHASTAATQWATAYKQESMSNGNWRAALLVKVWARSTGPLLFSALPLQKRTGAR
eukprot:277922-Karenia_brevis.AAC.1